MKSQIDRTFRVAVASLLGVLLLAVFTNDAAARGRSFPIEVTGRVLTFDRANQTFTIRVDEPASILTIGVGRDCKFKRNGGTASERIITRGARVKVSYFATIFTGNIAVEIELNPTPELATGIIQTIDISNRRLVLVIGPEARRFGLRWATDASFIRGGKPTSVAALTVRSLATVAYYSPAFASKYAVNIDLK